MFGLFNKKPEIISEDLVWKNNVIKFNALKTMINNSGNYLFVYYFQDTKLNAESMFREAAIAYSEHVTPNDKIVLVSADSLQKQISITERSIIFLEHYPSFDAEQNILNQLLTLGINKVTFINSFDDPILNYFGKNVVALLEKMGLKEDEVIQHNMITQSIKNAQKKIDEKVTYPSNTRNAKDWIITNLGENIN